MAFLTKAANRGSIATGYDIDNSLKFEPDNSESITTTNQAAGNQKTWTWSGWLKRTELSYNWATIFGAGNTFIRFYSDDRLGFDMYDGTVYDLITTQVFRDTSAWYHIVAILDTTQATESERARLYVNGERMTVFDTETYPPQNADLAVGGQGSSSNWLQLGTFYSGGNKYAGYMAEIHYLNGTVAEPTEFGEYDSDSGIWIPKEYTGGGYGTQGFYYKFDNASNLGEDSSGEGHDANSLGNITSADQATDTPTNNFCTWNPLWAYQYQPTIKEGATVAAYGDSTDENAKATIGLTNGKWYWEAKPSGTIGSQFIGISTDGDSNISSGQGMTQNYQMTIEPQGRYYSYAGSLSESSAGQFTALTTSDTLGIALDMDSATQTIKYYANGSLILTRDLITEMQGRTVFPFLQNYESRTFNINFGGYTINTISSAASDADGYGTFEYSPPSGYYAICTKNLAEYGG
jgi:hypothetical protein